MLEPTNLPDQKHRLKRVSHIALVVEDPTPAHTFCTEVLGMRYSTCFLNEYRPGTDIPEPYIHTFYTMDDGTSLAYFVMLPGAPQPTPDYISHAARHFAFQAESAADLPKWAEKLRSHNVEVTEDYNESDPTLRFCDPNGVRFEIKAPKVLPSENAEQTALQTLEKWLAEK